jgi:hypothetical protein
MVYYLLILPTRRRLAMGAPTHSLVSQEDLIRLALKLRDDLINYEDKCGSSREFAELMNSAGALVIAITEPEEFLRSASQTGNA